MKSVSISLRSQTQLNSIANQFPSTAKSEVITLMLLMI